MLAGNQQAGTTAEMTERERQASFDVFEMG
jgi:hypothetical protein